MFWCCAVNPISWIQWTMSNLTIKHLSVLMRKLLNLKEAFICQESFLSRCLRICNHCVGLNGWDNIVSNYMYLQFILVICLNIKSTVFWFWFLSTLFLCQLESLKSLIVKEKNFVRVNCGHHIFFPTRPVPGPSQDLAKGQQMWGKGPAWRAFPQPLTLKYTEWVSLPGQH